MTFKAPYYSKEQLREEAANFCKQYNCDNEIPFDIEFVIESDFGIDIVPVPGLQNSYDIVAFISQDQREIRVDDYVYENRLGRYRFSLAHELAHVLLHGSIWDNFSFSTISEWKVSVTQSIPKREYGYLEFHANQFAGLILVPEEPLLHSLDNWVSKIRKEGLDPYDENLDAKGMIEEYIAREFEVSPEVVRKRIDFDSIWDNFR